MLSCVDLFFEDEHSNAECANESANMDAKSNIKLIRRHIRNNSNPLELPDKVFIAYFRLNKTAFQYLMEEIQDWFKRYKSTSVPNILRLACVLRFFADGTYQKNVGTDYNLGVSQPTVSNIIKEVLEIFELTILKQWLEAEMTPAEKQNARSSFLSQFGLPGVIGCIDGTHINIVAKNKQKDQYLNRKGIHSLNTMIACDHNMVIRHVDARCPGSKPDSFAWNNSELKKSLEKRYRNGQRSEIYLGDSDYPLSPYLLTPFPNARIGSRESLFNKRHENASNVVERAIGMLKCRFRCLWGARRLNYAPERAIQIIKACCALHNICLHFNVEVPKGYERFAEPVVESDPEELPAVDARRSEGEQVRKKIMLSLCN